MFKSHLFILKRYLLGTNSVNQMERGEANEGDVKELSTLALTEKFASECGLTDRK